MSYDEKAFWEAYEQYVVEALPRHCDVINRLRAKLYLSSDAGPYNRKRLIDLGCGQCAEAKRLFVGKSGLDAQEYLGLDVMPPDGEEYRAVDYRNLKKLDPILEDYKPDIFSSLFSIEPGAPFGKNYELYKHVFKTCPSIKSGVVAGFYYKDKLNKLKIIEAHNIISYQSIEAKEIVKNEVFTEYRRYVEAPSKLFGNNVVEVWKWFERNND